MASCEKGWVVSQDGRRCERDGRIDGEGSRRTRVLGGCKGQRGFGAFNGQIWFKQISSWYFVGQRSVEEGWKDRWRGIEENEGFGWV